MLSYIAYVLKLWQPAEAEPYLPDLCLSAVRIMQDCPGNAIGPRKVR